MKVKVTLSCLFFLLLIIGCSKTDQSNSSSNNYYYNSCSCLNGTACVNTLGHNTGSAGPFCSFSSCQSWAATNVQIYSNNSSYCGQSANYTIYYQPTSGSCM